MAAIDLVTRFIEEDWQHPGAAGARLRDSAIAVWVLVAQLPSVNGNVSQLASDYQIPVEAVEAALIYYRRHKQLIDAQIALNAA